MVGPLVVGGFATSVDRVDGLRDLGVRDSKLLSAGRREVVYRALAQHGRCPTVTLAPREIDRWVSRGGLNALELTAFAQLVCDERPDVVFVDACDPNAERFGRHLAELVPDPPEIIARHRADVDLAVVGAASIVAKVTRDRAVARLRRRLGDALGSGYPSDSRTQSFVAETVRAGGALPAWVRASWAPVQRVKRARSARTLDEFSP